VSRIPDQENRLRHLVEANVAVGSEASLEDVLQKTVEVAARLVVARYAALGVLDRTGSHLKVDDAVTFALSAGARRLVLFHHDPLHGDSDLEALLISAARLWGDEGTPPALAHEGLTIELH
jgi:ribonuclease BN (tRNA processing enzyme)